MGTSSTGSAMRPLMEAVAGERREEEAEARWKVAGALPVDDMHAARLEIVASLERFIRLNPGLTLRDFVSHYNHGAIGIGACAQVAHVSEQSLYRWRRAAREGAPGARRGGLRPRLDMVLDRDAEMRDLAVTMLRERRRIRARHVAEALSARFADRPQPSIRAIQRFLSRYRRERQAELEMLNHPDGYRSKYRVALADSDSHVVRLNQEWQWDGTRGDAQQTLPAIWCQQKGRRVRSHVTIGIDVYSRRLKGHVSRHASSAASRALLYRMLLDWGVPETMVEDNGSENAAETERVRMDLGITVIPCDPYKPQQKGIIERAVGTMMHDLFERLPGYVGHNVADRQEIESRQSFADRRERGPRLDVSITPEQLQGYIDNWCDHIYGNRLHSALGGKTPNQVGAQYGGEIRRLPDDGRALVALFADSGLRSVTKSGIRIENTTFWSHALIPYIGAPRVRVFSSPDMGRIAVYREHPREFICWATNPEREGIDRAAAAMAAKRLQSIADSKLRAEHRTLVRRLKPHRILDEAIAHQAAVAPVYQPAPAKVVGITTDALEAAREEIAAATGVRAPAQSHSRELIEEGSVAIMEAARRRRARAIEDEENDAAWARRCELRERFERGDELAQWDRDWLARYEAEDPYAWSMIEIEKRGRSVAL